MLSNPEVMRNIIQAHPGLRQVRRGAHAPAGGTGQGSRAFRKDCARKPYLPLARASRPRRARKQGTQAASQVPNWFAPFPPRSRPQLMDSHPELAHMLNNPEMLRESLRVMANPVS